MTSLSILNTYHNALRSKDFKTFAAYCRIYTEFSNDFMMLKHSNWTFAQKQFEKNRTGKDIVLKPRRIGFTTLELARDLFFALTNPGSTTFIVTQDSSLAKDAIRKINDFIDYLREIEKKIEAPYQMVPGIKYSNTEEIVFSTGAKIQAANSKADETSANKTGRGTSITRLHCTETAFWEFAELTMQSVMIAAKNAKEIVIESTANGSSGYFYNFYTKVKNGEAGPKWKHHFFPWYLQTENKSKFDTREQKEKFQLISENEYEQTLIEDHQITKEQLKWWREQIAQNPFGLSSVLQEYPIDEASCFRTKSQTFLDPEDFEYLERSWIQPLAKEHQPLAGIDEMSFLHIWEQPKEHKRYIIGADTAYGSTQGTGDYSCFYVIERETGNICACFSSNKINPTNYGKIIVDVAKKYNKAFVAVEFQASGGSVIEAIKSEGYHNLYKHQDKDYYGWFTTTNRRIEMFNLLQKMIKEKDPQIIDLNMVKQFKSLVFKNNKIQHLKGSHDDHIMAFMIAQIVRKEVPELTSTGYVSVSKSKLGNLGFSRIGSMASKGISLR